MPRYDYQCADCQSTREAQVSFSEADSLELTCVNCGGSMKRKFSTSFVFSMSGRTNSSPPPTPQGKRKKQRTCAHGAVKLTRSNPFAKSLPAKPASGGQER